MIMYVIFLCLLFLSEEDVISFDDAAQRDQNQKMFPKRYGTGTCTLCLWKCHGNIIENINWYIIWYRTLPLLSHDTGIKFLSSGYLLFQANKFT